MIKIVNSNKNNNNKYVFNSYIINNNNINNIKPILLSIKKTIKT